MFHPAIRAVLALTASTLPACSVSLSTVDDPVTPADAGTDVPVGPSLPDCPAGQVTAIESRVNFPSGALPVNGAIVYIPSQDGISYTGECGECVDRTSVLAFTTTATDGRFRITNVPAGHYQLVIEKGRFRRTAEVDVAACQTTVIPKEAVRLPRNSTEGQVPRIAVITGLFDQMQNVLKSLGLDESAYDLISGDSWSGEDVEFLVDRERLLGYDIVFVNCGSEAGEVDGVGSTAIANLREFVETGGRLYVTDRAYDVIERFMPEAVDYGSPGGVTDVAEPWDVAQVGDSTNAVRSTVEDEGLSDWLSETGALLPSGEIEIRGFLSGWAVMSTTAPEATKVWVRGEVKWNRGRTGIAAGRAVRPLTVSFERGCGRALYSSYHTVGSDYDWEYDDSGGGTGTTEMPAQEQALAYLALEVGSCIDDPTIQ